MNHNYDIKVGKGKKQFSHRYGRVPVVTSVVATTTHNDPLSSTQLVTKQPLSKLWLTSTKPTLDHVADVITGKLAAEVGISSNGSGSGNGSTNKPVRNPHLPIHGMDIQLLKERNTVASTYVNIFIDIFYLQYLYFAFIISFTFIR